VDLSLPSSATFVNAAISIALYPHTLTGANESVMNFRSINTKRPGSERGRLRVSPKRGTPHGSDVRQVMPVEAVGRPGLRAEFHVVSKLCGASVLVLKILVDSSEIHWQFIAPCFH
jgi:hypothetical protein